MPSKSQAQHNLMAMVAHDPKAAKRVGIPQSVGRDYVEADKGKKLGEGIADLFIDTEKLAQQKAKSDQNFADRTGKYMGQQIGDQYAHEE